MAWNEPGGSNRGDKDPWGNRDNEGPPDSTRLSASCSRTFPRCLVEVEAATPLAEVPQAA